MTDKKANRRPKGAATSPQRVPANAPRAQRNPATRQGQRPANPASVDEAIAKAQTGRVNVPPAKAIEMAGKLYSRNQYTQAERVCRQIIAARPANADAHNILGVSLAALGQTEAAIDSIKRAIKINAKAPSYHANLGEVLRQAGRLDEASTSLEQAVKLDPNNAQALNNLGIIHYDRRKFSEAVDYYRKALAVPRTWPRP